MELVAVVKRECETCKLVEPVLAQIHARAPLALYSQDDPAFPESLGGATDDTALERSWQLKVETVPTLIRFEAGREWRLFAKRAVEIKTQSTHAL